MRTRIFGYALLILQSFLAIILVLQSIGLKYDTAWKNYLDDQSSHIIYLSNVKDKYKDDVEQYLTGIANTEKLLLVKKVSNANETSSTIKIGVAGNPKNEKLNFYFYNKKIIDTNDIKKLLKAKKSDATIGMDNSSLNTIKTLPNIPFTSKIVIYQLNQLNQKEKSISGNYQLVGNLSERKFQLIVNRLSHISHKTRNQLLTKNSGYGTKPGILYFLLIMFNIVNIISIFAFYLAYLVKKLKKYGSLVLLGWSKHDIYSSEVLPFLIMSVLVTLVSGITTFARYLFLNFTIFRLILGLILALFMINVVTFSLSFLMVNALSNIDLIKNRFPHRFLYSFLAIFYLGLNIGVVMTGIFMDRPMQSVIANKKQAEQWNKVSDFMVLNKIDFGSSGNEMINDSSSDLNRSMFKFYSDIAREKGVYLIHSDYVSRKQLTRLGYSKLNPFWQFETSPEYLKKVKIQITKYLPEAYAGTRVYLIPDQFSEEQVARIKKFIKRQDQEGISEGDIQTQFVQHRKFEFVKYHYSQALFTWNTDTDGDIYTTAPVIYIATPENMTFFEIGNLSAAGLDGYLKFKNISTQRKFVNNKFLRKYNLEDNKLKFLSVKNYIDGLRKSLIQTIQWFGMILAILLILLIFNSLILMMIFRIANQEKIFVKTFLGYSIFEIYTPILALIIGINFLCMLVTLLLQSKLGLLFIFISFIIQLLFLWLFGKKSLISESKKGEL